MYRCVIFDLDGTLLNTLDDLADAGNYALRKLGFPAHDVEEYKYYVGNGIPKLIQRILPSESSHEMCDKAQRLFSEYYSSHSMDKTRPYDGIYDLLSRLVDDGIKIGIATNKDHDFAEKLVHVFFGDMVSVVLGRKDGSPKKPDPFSVNCIMEMLNAGKSNTLYAGDSNVDMETALNADLASCGVLWGFRTEKELRESGARFIAKTPNDLYQIINQ